jgi:hypothetical protein
MNSALRLWLIYLGIALGSGKVFSQSKEDSISSQIRIMESREARAFAKGDLPDLYKIWDQDFVWNEDGRSIHLPELQNALKFNPNAEVQERSFSVYIINSQVAVVMGQTQKQAFTDVWTGENNTWRLFTRQRTTLK